MMKIQLIQFIPLFLLLATGVAHAQLSPDAQALVLDKQVIDAIESGDHAAAAQFFERRARLDVAVPPPLRIEMAKVYYALGDYLAAHETLAEYLNAVAPDSPNYDTALNMYVELEANPEYLAALRVVPGRVFRDCDVCPEMVVVPAGSFRMGSPSSEEDRDDDEGPVHQVTMARPFAVGVYAVTFAEWDACVADGGCGGYSPGDEGWGRGRGTYPVVWVSWDEVQSYLGWLSDKTGKSYRLLSESEWEYVARAGTTTPFFYTDSANQFGLHTYGNESELVQDCWNESYAGAPDDGSAWESGDCSKRVVRGNSGINDPQFLRSADRDRLTSGSRSSGVGFRVARTLTP